MWIMLVLGMILVVGVFKPGIGILVGVGLAPTLATWLVETKAFRVIRLRAIFFFNLAGVFPFIAQVLQNGGGFQQAYGIISNLPTLGLMYAPVIAAMVALWAGPFASAFVSQVIAGDKARRVLKAQKQLVNEWGPDIVGSNKSFFAETGFRYEKEKSPQQEQNKSQEKPEKAKNISSEV